MKEVLDALGEPLLNVFFYIFAATAVGGALAVALSRNIVRSAFSLLAVLFATAAFYAFMRADFVFAAQILIYVGGILVLIIFAIMLTHRITDVRISNESTHGPAAFFACLCVLFALAVVALAHRWDREGPPAEVGVQEGGAPVALRLRMFQADATYGGRGTGILRGGMMLDGRGYLVVEAGELPAWMFRADQGRQILEGGARFQILRGEKKEGAWAWTHVPNRKGDRDEPREAGFQAKGPSRYEARLEVSGLEPGRYRWSAALVSETHQTTPAGFGASDAGETADFTVERGLTRTIGMALAGPYLLPFEVVSVLLLAALVGAAFLARKEVKP